MVENSLEELYKGDIRDRRNISFDDNKQLKELAKRDSGRKLQVMKLFSENKLSTAKDFHHASLIMQHGETADDYKLAHQFAEKAVTLGDETARWLYAATYDRWLLSTGKPQRYGTQIIQRDDGEYAVAGDLDPNVTDAEREKWHVPPLSQAVEKFKEKYDLN